MLKPTSLSVKKYFIPSTMQCHRVLSTQKIYCNTHPHVQEYTARMQNCIFVETDVFKSMHNGLSFHIIWNVKCAYLIMILIWSLNVKSVYFSYHSLKGTQVIGRRKHLNEIVMKYVFTSLLAIFKQQHGGGHVGHRANTLTSSLPCRPHLNKT